MTLEEVKGYAFLNIFGLAAGMACCILIGLWVLDELNYDRFHENASSICRVESDQDFNGRTLHIYWTPHPLGPGIVALMCREFLMLIGLANLIAWPVAYFAVKDWLNNFAYRTQIPTVFFIGALATSLAIGLMTVIYKAIRAASANPVDALKHE